VTPPPCLAAPRQALSYSEWFWDLLAGDLVTLREATQLLQLELAYRELEREAEFQPEENPAPQ
jgi:hypothetical protein